MFSQLFPQRIDNTYRGHTLALWVFGVLVFMTVGMSESNRLSFNFMRVGREES